jgi:PKD repeat protein
MKRIIAFAIMAMTLAVSCNRELVVEVLPDFTTDKEVYGLNEPVTITNATVVKNSVAAITKWEYSGKVYYGEEAPQGIKFAEVGEYPVTLTVTANDGFVQASCTKNIKVEDTNIRPVVDFTWKVNGEDGVETIKVGDVVTFTGIASDPDGEITAWEWKIGSGSSTEQNPTYQFIEYGEVQISLTVTDNMFGKTTKTVTVNIEPGKFKLDLDWKKTYDGQGGFTRFTSPAMAPDAQAIYVTSSGGKMVKISRDGEQLWVYDYAAKHGTRYANNAGTKETVVVTPSVDEDGTVYFAAGFNEPGGSPSGVDNGIMAINADGTLKWYAKGGPNTRFGSHSPLVLKDCIATTQTHSGKQSADPAFVCNDQGCVVINKADGTQRQTIYATSGSNGSICAYNDKIFVNVAKGNGGAQVGFPSGENAWSLVNGSSTNKAEQYWPGRGYKARSCQPAVTSNGEILLYYPASETDASAGGVLFCYDDESIKSTTTVAPEYKWMKEIPGELYSVVESSAAGASQMGGHGPALASDGTIYVTTRTFLVALNSNGEKLWEHQPAGTIMCVPAVDGIGCVYYCDSEGNVVKLSSAGVKLAAINLGAKFTSSITIAQDGRLYLVGLEGGAPTLFALSTDSCDGPSQNWSQLSGGPCKRSSVYTK